MQVQQELTLSIGTQMRELALVGQNSNSDYLVCCCRATCRGRVTWPAVQATRQRVFVVLQMQLLHQLPSSHV
jgi:hypothetical protein